jgi:two-component system, NarL family, sensor histidine kinase UhpB
MAMDRDRRPSKRRFAPAPPQQIATDELHERVGDRCEALLRAGAAEAAAPARELGHAALAAGVGVVDLAALHQQAFARVLAENGGRCPGATAAAARDVLLEALAPYETSLRLARESNAALRRLNEALEEQSRQIARALHDNANQLVASMGIAIAALEREPGVRRGRLVEMRETLEQIGNALRRASHDLRPPALDDLGVVPALEQFARGLPALGGVDVRFVGSTEGRLAPSVETALYWVVQEALTNIARHARARRVWVHVERAPSSVTCVVSDDGVGFDLAAVAGRPDRGLGLISIRERLGALGGTLAIASSPGAGTTLTAKLPSGGIHADPRAARG